MTTNNNNFLLRNLLNKHLKYNKSLLIKALSKEAGISPRRFYAIIKNDKILIRYIKILHLLTDYKVGELIEYRENIDTLVSKEMKNK